MAANVIPFPRLARKTDNPDLIEARENIASLELRHRAVTAALDWWRAEMRRLERECA